MYTMNLQEKEKKKNTFNEIFIIFFFIFIFVVKFVGWSSFKFHVSSCCIFFYIELKCSIAINNNKTKIGNCLG